MTEYRVAVSKEVLAFAAAHFITFGADGCEPLHGHNYRVGVTLTGDLGPDELVYDFVALKRHVEALLLELDHRVILPETNPHLQLNLAAGQVEVRHSARRYVFPRSDAVILPVPNTTAEKIAEYLGGRLLEALGEIGGGALRRIEMEVEEAPGQSAFWTGHIGT
jgi:6-pyruvoyltetrahydropterin/6-carboxytetrahydropterin synthase